MNMTVPRPRPRMFHAFCSAMGSLDRWHNGRDIKAQESGRDCSNVLYAFSAFISDRELPEEL
jgi:hypothetical protein